MNSRSKPDNAQRAGASFNNYEFDFGLGGAFARSSASGSLRQQQNATAQSAGGAAAAPWAAQKPAPSSSSSSSSSWASPSSSKSTQPSPSSSSSGAAWTWQGSSSGSGGLHAPARSMVGDITGKGWGAAGIAPKSGINKSGLVGGLNRGASADLFGDLLGSSRSFAFSANSKPPQQQQQALNGDRASPFSGLGAMAASLPKGTPMKDLKASKASETDEMGDFVSADASQKSDSADAGWADFEAISSSRPSSSVKTPQQHSQKPSNEDPFGDFLSIPSAKSTAFASSTTSNVSYGAKASSSSDDLFNFTASRPSEVPASKSNDTSTFPTSIDEDPFAFLGSSKMTASQPIDKTSVESDPFESFLGKVSSQPKQTDPVLESLWGSTKPQPGPTEQNVFSDWGLETDFGADDHTDTTTELDGLPPPPPSVTVTLSKEKGLEYYKQGQFADAIKWLSWAEILLHQNGEGTQIIEVLTCRSSCLKEVGEYKKAVADCTKVIELDNGNTRILLQRALLYESMEKYNLGIEDLKEVLKNEPQNRVAMTTLARLKKMAD